MGGTSSASSAEPPRSHAADNVEVVPPIFFNSKPFSNMKNSVKIIILGSVLFTGGIVFGLGGTIVSMIDTFDAIGVSDTGDPEILAAEISNALVTTAVGIPVAFIGFCLFLGGTIAYFVGKNKLEISTTAAQQ